jgi:hypothetical protein
LAVAASLAGGSYSPRLRHMQVSIFEIPFFLILIIITSILGKVQAFVKGIIAPSIGTKIYHAVLLYNNIHPIRREYEPRI